MTPSISVVIPAYQARDFLHRPVRSVLRQTTGDWELIIVSDDGTDYGPVLRQAGLWDSRLRCLLSGGIGTGPSHARNTGLAAARGRVVSMLDADDSLAPDALERLAPLALEHGAAYSRIGFLDHVTEQPLESLDRPVARGLVGLEEILTSQIHTYAGIVFDRQRVGARWPAWIQRWEDVYFYAKCFDSIDWMYHLPEPLYFYYRRPGSICNRPETAAEYKHWAEELAARMEQGESLGFERGAVRRTFHRFLRGRQLIEASFIEALQRGQCSDFHQFIRQRGELFHHLLEAA